MREWVTATEGEDEIEVTFSADLASAIPQDNLKTSHEAVTVQRG